MVGSPIHGWAVPARATQKDLRPGQVLTVSVVALTGVTVLDLTDGTLGFAFGLGFGLISTLMALWSRGDTLLTPGILPPFLMLSAVVAVAALYPSAVDVSAASGQPGFTARIVAGMLNHSTALIIGHVAALSVIAVRQVSRIG